MNVSALSEDDSADHDQDIMVVQMLLDDEEAYMTSVRSYLPSPAQVRAESPHAAGLLTYCSGFYNSPRVPGLGQVPLGRGNTPEESA